MKVKSVADVVQPSATATHLTVKRGDIVRVINSSHEMYLIGMPFQGGELHYFALSKDGSATGEIAKVRPETFPTDVFELAPKGTQIVIEA